MSLSTWQATNGKIIKLGTSSIFGGIEIGHTQKSSVYQEKCSVFYFKGWDADIGESCNYSSTNDFLILLNAPQNTSVWKKTSTKKVCQ